MHQEARFQDTITELYSLLQLPQVSYERLVHSIPILMKILRPYRKYEEIVLYLGPGNAP
jgi:hypothetical protein